MYDEVWHSGMLSDELWHHGILGQMWGKRNGPPYPLDPRKHSVEEKVAAITKRPNYSVKSRVISEMTDDELKAAINRMKQEKEYKSLYAELNPKKKSLLSKAFSGAKTHGPKFLNEAFIKPLGQAYAKELAAEWSGKNKTSEKEKEEKKKEQQKRDDEIVRRMSEIMEQSLREVQAENNRRASNSGHPNYTFDQDDWEY